MCDMQTPHVHALANGALSPRDATISTRKLHKFKIN